MRIPATTFTGEPDPERERELKLLEPAGPASNGQKLQRTKKYVNAYHRDTSNKRETVENSNKQKLN